MEGGTVAGQQHTQQQCCIKALELHAQNAEAWDALGDVGVGRVDGQLYTDGQMELVRLPAVQMTGVVKINV